MNLNVVIVGHVDHGKSTLIGRLLYDSESIKNSISNSITIALEAAVKLHTLDHGEITPKVI